MKPKSRRPGEGSGSGMVLRSGHRSLTTTIDDLPILALHWFRPCELLAMEIEIGGAR